MIFTVVDIETNGLLKTVTQIHCMSIHTIWEDGTTTTMTLRTHDAMREFINKVNALVISRPEKKHTIVGHNFVRFDNPALKKVLGVGFEIPIMDSLAFSWYLYPLRTSHNLADWGTDLGIAKPYIEDWSEDNIENIIIRCEADVQINVKLFKLMLEYLKKIYPDMDSISRIIGYLKFKMECAAEQEETRWRLDKAKCEQNLQVLRAEIQPKLNKLVEAMPRDIKYKTVERPQEKFLKKDGTISVAGQKWIDLMKSMGLPEYHTGSVQVPEHDKPGNPQSPIQLKNWLFSLGWIPDYFKYTHTKAGLNKVPQINNQEGTGVCDSVIALEEKEPAIHELDKLTKLKHRIGLLEGFLSSVDEDGFVTAEIMGLTNTLRFQHTGVVNLPTVVKTYGGIVREVLIAPDDDHILCGSDMAGIEEATKHHYMYFYDPERVKKIRTPGYDPHLSLSVEAKLCTETDMEFYKWYDQQKELDEKKEIVFEPTKEQKERYKTIKDIRINKGKKTNFGAVYGAGVPKLAMVAGITIKESSVLHKAFWIINKAVKLVAKYTKHKTIGDQMWLFNPVSGFWYTLRAEKDKFSTLNQGTAVYCFDMQVKNVRKKGVKMCGQFHDEWVAPILKTDKERVRQIAEEAIIETNAELRLNVELGIKVEFGPNYAEIH